MIFKSFNIDFFEFRNNILYLHYNFDKKVFFIETIDFNIWEKIKNFNKNTLDFLFYNILIANWISYYKLYPFANINLPVNLTEKQLNFWYKFYLNWLGEFFYKNKINPNVVNLKLWKKELLSLISTEKLENKSLLLRWGWKDSIVSSQLLKDTNFDLLVVGKLDNIKLETAKILWKNPILIKRTLDSNLFYLNNQAGFYNWHVPITWIISFISLATAYLYWYKNIFTSNEKSASEENLIWKGFKINHQYSKSIEFEQDFKNYIKDFTNINYKSLLSNLTELEIAEKFSKYKKFHKAFSSCNKNFSLTKKSTKKWCCNCEKCSFVWLILSAYLEPKEMVDIFGENLFEKKELLEIFKWFITKNKKPFECVWTYNESKKAFKLAIKKYEKLPFILKEIKKYL